MFGIAGGAATLALNVPALLAAPAALISVQVIVTVEPAAPVAVYTMEFVEEPKTPLLPLALEIVPPVTVHWYDMPGFVGTDAFQPPVPEVT
jgi:hypothetical protein